VGELLERSADDANASNGCKVCANGRDPLTGWGHLDVARAVQALAQPLPAADRYESNDDAGTHAHTVFGRVGKLGATLDYYDDDVDVYRVRLAKGQRLSAHLTGQQGSDVDLVLWKPGTRAVDDLRSQGLRAAQSAKPGSSEQVLYRVPATGWYYLEAKLTAPTAAPMAYTLAFAKR
jgi:hypothetical protein